MWIRHEIENGASVLYLDGAWRLGNLRPISGELASLELPRGCTFTLDGSGLGELDTSAAFTLCRHLAERGCDEAMVGTRAFDPRLERLLRLVRSRMRTPPSQAKSTHRGLLSRLGIAAIQDWQLIKVHNAFIGLIAVELAALARRPKLFRSRETVSQFEDVCLDAIPVVSLVTFLIGVVIAYLLGVQARQYGAGIFVVDGVGLAVCRELSPILVAVVVAGRSGAAFTAQIGAMKVQDEVDAIRTLGLSPIQVLVIPRLVALTFALPLLVFIGDLCGIAGGIAAASWQLGILPVTFIERLHAVLPISAFTVGIGKAPVFAVFIAIIACRMGLLVSRDARSVGENTTSTVVQCIVSVIVLDAIFAVTLQRLGI